VRRLRTPAIPQAVQMSSRSGLLALRAAELALRDARIRLTEGRRHRCAVVFGTHFGSIESVHAFDADALRRGKRLVNATLFPDCVINAPAGYVGASFQLRGPNLTVSTGISSGLSALALGQELLDSDQADVVLAGGYDALSALVLSLAEEDRLLHPMSLNRLSCHVRLIGCAEDGFLEKAQRSSCSSGTRVPQSERPVSWRRSKVLVDSHVTGKLLRPPCAVSEKLWMAWSLVRVTGLPCFLEPTALRKEMCRSFAHSKTCSESQST